MTTSSVYTPIPRAYALNPMGIWGHQTLAQHLHDMATLEHPVKTKEPDVPPAHYSTPGWFSPWFQPSVMGYRRQHTAALFDPTDEIVLPKKKENHFFGPKEPISPTRPTQTETPTKEEPSKFDVGAVALADPLAVPFQSIDLLIKDSRITPKTFGTKDDGDDDWVDFSNYKKLKGSSEFIEIGATKFRISPPPGSASRLAKILKDRGRWTGNYTAKKTYSVPCDGANNLAQWGHPPLVSV